MRVHEQDLLRGGGSRETFIFADLCGFAEYTLRYGDDRAAELAVGFHRLVRQLADDEGCDVVKSLGDGVMVRSTDCRVAVRLAHRVLSHSARRSYPPIRIGLDRGSAVQRDGDWYGATVNVAARLADAARPGELLLSERARAAIPDTESIKLIPRGTRRLKGLPASLVHAAIAV